MVEALNGRVLEVLLGTFGTIIVLLLSGIWRNLGRRMETLSADVKSLYKRWDSLSERLTRQEERRVSHATSIDNLTSGLRELSENVRRINDRCILLHGQSKAADLNKQGQ